MNLKDSADIKGNRRRAGVRRRIIKRGQQRKWERWERERETQRASGVPFTLNVMVCFCAWLQAFRLENAT